MNGTKREAEAHLTELLRRLREGDFVEPSKVTFGEWLDRWLEFVVAGQKAPRTEERYRDLVRLHIATGLGCVPRQETQSGTHRDFLCPEEEGGKAPRRFDAPNDRDDHPE